MVVLTRGGGGGGVVGWRSNVYCGGSSVISNLLGTSEIPGLPVRNTWDGDILDKITQVPARGRALSLGDNGVALYVPDSPSLF